MSVIQKIRDKYARIAVIAIALALLGFILMDAFAGRGSFLGGRDTALGKINGKKIDAEDFMRRVSNITRRQQGADAENSTAQVVNQLWQQELTDKIMGEQYNKLGLTVSDKELDQLLFGPNPPQAFRQAFGNPNDPQSWDPGLVRQQYNQINKSGTPDQKQELAGLVNYIVAEALQNKYNALLTNSVYIPKWFLEKRNVDNSQMAKAAFVTVPYTTIADSTVKISDAEINDYVKAHQKEYEQKEEGRSVSYVAFSAAPSAADSAAVRNQLTQLKDSFQHNTNTKDFLVQNRSLAQYQDQWIAAKDLQLQNSDTIFKTPVGSVSGPFTEPGTMLLAKILDTKTQPDTAKVRHILISTTDPQSGTQVRDTVAAKRIADSVMQVLASGVPFDSVVMKVSDDPGKAINRGVYDSITRQSGFVPEFKEYALNNAPGTKGVVKTQFGYHYMEVLSQRGSSPVYKAAFFALPIEASAETQSAASNEAAMFAGNTKDKKSFDQYFEKNLKAKGYQKQVAPNLHPMDFFVTGINGSARELVKDIFKANEGDVVSPSQPIDNSYIVALVTEVDKPGLPSAESVRSMVEPILITRKKAEIIKNKMGKVADLNAVAAKFSQSVQPADSLRFGGGGALGYETRVLGAIFNPANKGKVCADPITGQTGVYAIRTDAVFTAAVENANIEQQRQALEAQSRQMFRSPLEVLQKRVEVKDYRSNFY